MGRNEVDEPLGPSKDEDFDFLEDNMSSRDADIYVPSLKEREEHEKSLESDNIELKEGVSEKEAYKVASEFLVELSKTTIEIEQLKYFIRNDINRLECVNRLVLMIKAAKPGKDIIMDDELKEIAFKASCALNDSLVPSTSSRDTQMTKWMTNG